MRNITPIVLSVALVTITTASADEKKADYKPGKADVRGKVTKVTESPAGGDALGKVLIEGEKEADTKHDKASVTVTKGTKVEKVVNGERKPARFEDIKKGAKVQADLTEPHTLSYPVMAGAKSVLILE
jgi:hypothetical protein